MLELIQAQPTQTLSNSLGSTLTASYINATLTAATLNPTERRTANEHLDRIRQEQPFQLDSYSVTLQYIDTAFMVHDAVSLLLLATGTGGVVYFGLRFAFKATAKHYAKRQLQKGLLGRTGAAKSATQIAIEGGRHAGQLNQFMKQTPEQLKKTIKSLDKQISRHEDWINDPTSKVKKFSTLRPEHQQNIIHHWQQDTARHQELKSIAQDVLKDL